MNYARKSDALQGFEALKVQRAREGDGSSVEYQHRESLMERLFYSRETLAPLPSSIDENTYSSDWRPLGFTDEIIEGYIEAQVVRYEDDDGLVNILLQKRAHGINGYEGKVSEPWLLAFIERNQSGIISVQTPQFNESISILSPIDLHAYFWQDIEDVLDLFLNHTA